MGSPTSVTTEEPGPRRKGATSCSRGTSKGDIDGVQAAYSDEEPPSRGPWPSEVPPSGLLPGMLGKMGDRANNRATPERSHGWQKTGYYTLRTALRVVWEGCLD